ncbi:MAG: selenium cofactor biosynthesis protein YqeC [Lachnospiraceae bacterium]
MIIAVVGAGGKTTRIRKLAEKYRNEGKRVLVTTTTHMYREDDCDISENPESIVSRLKQRGYCMAGSEAAEGKIGELPADVYEAVCEAADVVLVEADGSKHFPVKFPIESEPVIPENADEIQVVIGLSALGKPLKEVAHRKEQVMHCLGLSEDAVLQPEHLQKLLTEGYLRPLRDRYPDKKLVICPGQANTLFERAAAQCLREEYDVSVLQSSWFDAKPKLVICGAGHVGKCVARLGSFLDFEVTVIDDREAFANQEALPEADFVYCHGFDTVDELFPNAGNVFYVVLTRGHAADKVCVEKILNKPYTYLGMIGSKLKVAKTLELLRTEGFSEEQLSTIHAPIGISIGARTPEEISVSIAAELIREKNRVSVSSMSRELAQTDQSGVLCVITGKKGSSPRGVGSMMLVTENGIVGSIGGGILEKTVMEAAAQTDRIRSEVYRLTNEESAALGMICGGNNEILFIPLKKENL